MSIRKYLTEQMEWHPSAGFQDIVKLCYQAAFGAEHLLSDTKRAKAYLEKEFEETKAAPGLLFENISDEVCRVNLAVWKEKGLSVELLFQLFVKSATIREDADKCFEEYMAEAEELLRETESEEELAEWKVFLEKYRQAGMPSVHHSAEYREAEHPAYRIVKREHIKEISEDGMRVEEN